MGASCSIAEELDGARVRGEGEVERKSRMGGGVGHGSSSSSMLAATEARLVRNGVANLEWRPEGCAEGRRSSLGEGRAFDDLRMLKRGGAASHSPGVEAAWAQGFEAQSAARLAR